VIGERVIVRRLEGESERGRERKRERERERERKRERKGGNRDEVNGGEVT
jgi:hypothetical protein